MSKTHRLHKIIRHCVDQTGAQKVVFVGPEQDVRPYLGEGCIIKTGESDLFDADVLVYIGNDPVQRADLVDSAKVVIVDESDSHDRNIGIDRGNKKTIHLETRHGRSFYLDRSYPPTIIYTHTAIDGIFDLAAYNGNDICETFSTIGFVNTTQVGGDSGEHGVTTPEPTIAPTILEPEPAVEDTTTTENPRPVEEPPVVTTTTEAPVNDDSTTTTASPIGIDAEIPVERSIDGSGTATTVLPDTGTATGDGDTSEVSDATTTTDTTTTSTPVLEPIPEPDTTTTRESVNVDQETIMAEETTTTTEGPVDVTTTTIGPAVDGTDSQEPTVEPQVEPEQLNSDGDREQDDGAQDEGTVDEGVAGSTTTTTLEPSVESDTGTTPLPSAPAGDDSTVEGTTNTTQEPVVNDTTTTTTLAPRELARWLMQNKPFGKMTPAEKQLLHDEGLV